jgi:uncharacterized protein (DUF1501 family)
MLSRREILVNGLRVSALVPLVPSLGLARELARDRDGAERVLVVVQLTGGNDGLNTVVPSRQDAYYRLRPNLGLRRGALHALDDDYGLHPAMEGMGELFSEGRLAVVHGVGNPVPDRSHFRSLEVWHTADPFHPAGEVGWLGRMADSLAKHRPGTMPALAIEGGDLPLSMRGRDVMPPTVRDPRGFRTHEDSRPTEKLRDELAAEGGSGDLAYLRQVARTTYDTAQRMSAITEEEPKVAFPAHQLAQRLKLVSQLVRGDFGTRIFHLSMTGFDTHSRQGPVHENLMRQLSSGLTAFQRDLEAGGIADRVLTLVFSEFGRRAQENASRGTDHGAGAPVFLMGSKVRGGLCGTPPDLDALVDGDVPGTTDFRSVYTLLERDWMGEAPSSDVEALPLLG